MKTLSIVSTKLESLFICWLCFLPLLFTWGYFEVVKIFWFFLGGIFLVIPLLFKNSEKFKLEKSDFLYPVWILVLTIASLQGFAPAGSILGGAYRHQGVIFFLLLFLIKKAVEYLNEEYKKYLFYGLGLSVFIESFVIIFQKIFGVTYFDNPLGTLGDPNACAGFLLIGFFLVLQFLRNRKLILIEVIVVSLALISLHTATSLASIFLLLIFSIFKLLKQKKLAILIGVILVATSILFIFIFRQNKFSPYENRVNLWFLGSKMYLRRPILGYGPETTDLVYTKIFKEVNFSLSNLVYDRSHNLILDLLLWSGVIGAIVFFVWLTTETLKLRRNFLKIGTLLIWLGFSFYHPLGVVHWILLMLIFSL